MSSKTHNRRRYLFHCLGGVLICLAGASYADDTEIYVGVDTMVEGIRPNVVFIIDTSGSMDTDMDVVSGVYDPATTYSGSCSSSRLYWSSGSSLPSCGGSYYFDASSFVCDASQAALDSVGYASDRYARYRTWGSDAWRDLSRYNHTNLVECQSDSGIHGLTADGSYAADEDDGGPFSSNASDSVSWAATGDHYTIYTANYLNWRNGSGVSTTMTRLEIVQDVLGDILDSTSGINVALMRFDSAYTGNRGGYFVHEMVQLNSSSRADLKAAVNAMTPSGYTPLSETLYEAALFYRGEDVEFGDDTDPGQNVAGVLADSDTYESPIEYQCQKNFVVLLTDGEPTYDTDANDDIESLPSFATYGGSCGGSDNCLDELARYLAEKDQRSDLLALQTVNTYTIGFTLDHDLLRNTAEYGNGAYFTADDTAGLTDAFTAILNEILAVNTAFNAPAVPANAFNRLTHDGSLVFTLFRPEQRERWPGNLKRYTFDSDGVVYDVNDVEAIDPSSGFFKATSKSYWTPSTAAADGEAVEEGGFASQLSAARNTFTNAGGDLTDVTLSATANALHEDNAAITYAVLGIAEDADDRERLLKWARGLDVYDEDEDSDTTDSRHYVGDPLHSRPVPINYWRDDSNGETHSTVFFGTNEGFIHAVDTLSGAESFAYMPWELLPRLDTLNGNAPTSSHTYGVDGPFSSWVRDLNGNGVLYDDAGTLDTGEQAIIYATMRRGGHTIYALDVTDLASPELMWAIRGAQGDAFDDLGQTWTEPFKGKVRIDSTDRDVLFISGGYDPSEDEMDIVTAADRGNAMFIVDALTGELLWRAGGTDSGANLELGDLQFSTPGGVTVLDVDGDGLHELAYMADTGGQIFRFDFDMDADSMDSFATGGRIADLAGSTESSARRFYYRPDVSITQHNGSYVLALAIGSGFRAHPLDTRATNRFYVLFDSHLGSVPNSYATLDEDDLLDATSATLTTSGDSITGLSSADGWYVTLASGEKVLAESRTIDNLTLFTSYTPGAAAFGSCSPAIGLARVYAVNTGNSLPASGFYDVGDLADGVDLEDRTQVLVRGGIPPEPAVLFPPDGSSPKVLVSTETVEDVDLDNTIRRVKWSIHQ